jgi:hypothetical protein
MKQPSSEPSPASHHIAVMALHDAGEAIREARSLRYQIIILWVATLALAVKVCL